MPATFDGLQIFGRVVSMDTDDGDLALQKTEYCAVNGKESKTLGTRGRETNVRGQLWGPDLASFNAAERLVRSYKNGKAYTLFDTQGQIWFNVQFAGYAPEKVPLARDAATGQYLRNYTARLEHLL